MMKSILCGVFLVALCIVSQAEYDFGCNHYDSYTTDVCYQYSSSVQYKYSCNSSRSINLYEYDNNDCDSTNGKASIVTNYKLHNSQSFECDSKRSCDYARVIKYSDEECTGDDFYDYNKFITDECYESSYLSFLSYKYQCSGNALESTYYAGANCTGYKLTTKTVYDTKYNNLYSGCYQLVCAKGSESDSVFVCGVEMWAAVIVGTLLVLIALCIVCCIRRRKKLKRQLAMAQNDIDGAIPIEMIDNNQDDEDNAAPLANADHLRNSNEGIIIGETGSSNYRA